MKTKNALGLIFSLLSFDVYPNLHTRKQPSETNNSTSFTEKLIQLFVVNTKEADIRKSVCEAINRLRSNVTTLKGVEEFKPYKAYPAILETHDKPSFLAESSTDTLRVIVHHLATHNPDKFFKEQIEAADAIKIEKTDWSSDSFRETFNMKSKDEEFDFDDNESQEIGKERWVPGNREEKVYIFLGEKQAILTSYKELHTLGKKIKKLQLNKDTKPYIPHYVTSLTLGMAAGHGAEKSGLSKYVLGNESNNFLKHFVDRTSTLITETIPTAIIQAIPTAIRDRMPENEQANDRVQVNEQANDRMEVNEQVNHQLQGENNYRYYFIPALIVMGLTWSALNEYSVYLKNKHAEEERQKIKDICNPFTEKIKQAQQESEEAKSSKEEIKKTQSGHHSQRPA